MSSTVTGNKDGSDYAANYVRLRGGELPVRWSAIEVLREEKYSKASDVWAFGVLTYEVFSGGQQPYGEFATLAEVAERIKEGYTMGCPEGCRREVHTLVMQSCWKNEPSLRPGFGDLAKILIKLGAVPKNGVDLPSESSDNFAPSTVNDTATTEEWEKSLADRSLLGPSVHHICNVLAPLVVSTVSPPWKDWRGRSVDPPHSATISHTVQAVAKPAGANAICPRDGEIGCAYVDTLRVQDDVGRSVALLSYTWGYKVLSVGNALERWADQVGRNPGRAYIWICSLCLNQHRIGKQDQTPEQLESEFGPRVLSIGRILPMLEPWNDPAYLSRAWCLFELYTAIGEHERVEINIILTEEQHAAFVTAMAVEGYNTIDVALNRIQSAKATASRPADLAAIQGLISSKPGGFAQLDATVKQHLERCVPFCCSHFVHFNPICVAK